MRALITGCLLLMLAGCGSYSQARYDDLGNFKRNHFGDVQRAREGKLTAPELRSSLQSIDAALLAEAAHNTKIDLGKLQKSLEGESDDLTAELFDGDNGRSGSGPDGG